ncbi:MAG TPA: transcription antitermination factor NusB [Candidatus Dormibacteraeota bacterium]|nr:transcription antitermination factor NusB [Candidatus Dormibacteraeota bacterium]
MGPRHRARELAVQVLFQLELQPDNWRAPLQYHLEQDPQSPNSRRFAEALVEGAVAHQAEIDATIVACSTNWALDQMGALERAVLRIATEELCWRRQEPVAVVIDEAVQLAKQMAGEESGKFVNGVLGNIARASDQALEQAGARSPGR